MYPYPTGTEIYLAPTPAKLNVLQYINRFFVFAVILEQLANILSRRKLHSDTEFVRVSGPVLNINFGTHSQSCDVG
jgi:hypothetical protein